jgi:hypothetical protein
MQEFVKGKTRLGVLVVRTSCQWRDRRMIYSLTIRLGLKNEGRKETMTENASNDNGQVVDWQKNTFGGTGAAVGF